jgi:hypothetical protein
MPEEDYDLVKHGFSCFLLGDFNLNTVIPSAAWQLFFLLLKLYKKIFSPENSKKGLWTPS